MPVKKIEIKTEWTPDVDLKEYSAFDALDRWAILNIKGISAEQLRQAFLKETGKDMARKEDQVTSWGWSSYEIIRDNPPAPYLYEGTAIKYSFEGVAVIEYS